MSVFAPPDFVEKEESEWGRHVRLFSGDHHTLTIALSPVSEAHARAGDRTSIDGHFAHVEHTGRRGESRSKSHGRNPTDLPS
jgi:hypothetical protein